MNNPSTAFLCIDNLSVSYQKNIVLSNCSFALEQGEILSLLGPSGCGKSTLLRAITGLTPITQGRIQLADRILSSDDQFIAPAQRGIGMIFQDYALFPHLTVKENILFGLKTKVHQQGNKAHLQKTLDLFHLGSLQKRYPHQLSGGQQQRVAIARSLICEPDVLLFDEPFSNLDTQIRRDLMIEIKQLLKTQNMTAIFVTHNKIEAFALADKVAIMKAGHIVQFDSPQTLYDHPIDEDTADFLGTGINLLAEKTPQGWKTDLGIIPFEPAKEDSYYHKKTNSVYLRPHQLLLKSAQSDTTNYPIIASSFQGDFQEYTVQLPSQSIQVFSTERFTVGEHVAVVLSLD